MIRTENVSYSIKGKKLISDISVAFEPNEISMILGPNGAGKSTLINLLSQQISCTEGNVWFDNSDINLLPKNHLAKVRAVLSQNINMVFPLNVEEVVMMGRYPHFQSKPGKIDEAICSEAMALFNIYDMAKRNYQSLSGGEKQRVHFARVLSQVWPDEGNKTKVLLLDEPLTYLDIYYQHEFLTVLREFMQKQKMVIVGVVHDLNLAYKFADKVTLLQKGKLVSHGLKDEVISKDSIKAVFRVEPNILLNEKGERFLCF